MATTNAQIGSWASEYQMLKNEIAQLKGREAKLRDLLLAHVPVNTELITEDRRIIHSLYEQCSLDQSRLRQEAPDVYQQFSKVEERTKLTVR